MSKNSVIRKFALKVAVVLLAGSFCLISSCKNFLAGSDIIDQLEENIKYANAKTITLTLETETGTLADSGKNDCRVGYNFDLSFVPKTEDYVFLGWTCVDSVTKQDSSASVQFTDILAPKTTVKIIGENNITIVPKCAPRPKIKAFSPEYDQTGAGVPKNTSIIIEFEKNLDVPEDEKEKSEFLKKILVESNGPVTDKFSPSISENIITLVSKDLIDCKSGTQEVNVKIPGSYCYTEKNVKGEDVKIYLSEEYDESSPAYVTKKYLINNSTSTNTEIYFSADSELGKLSFSGLKTLYLGDDFEVSFTKNKNVTFLNWTIAAEGYTEEELTEILSLTTEDDEEKGVYKLSGKNNKSIKGVTVTAVGETIPISEIYFSVDSESGKLDFTGTKNLYVGESFTVTFTKSKTSNFSGWLITAEGYTREQLISALGIQFEEDEENGKYKILGIVKSGILGIKIAPIGDAIPTSEIYFSVDTDSGKMDFTGSKTLYVGENFTVTFTKNKSISFSGWNITAEGYTSEQLIEALGITTEEHGDIDKYIIRGSIGAGIKGVKISPDCMIIPTVSFYPPVDNAGYPQDTSIVLTFNTPVNKRDFINSNGTLASLISIVSGQDDLLNGETAFFANPYFDTSDTVETGTILTIPTIEGKKLLEVNDPNKKIISCSVNLAGLKNSDGTLFTTATDAYNATTSFSYLVNSSKDSEGPGISLKMYSESDPENRWYRELTNKLQTNGEWKALKREEDGHTYIKGDYSKNHVSKVYIKVQGYDKDSGLKCVRVHETYKKTVDNIEAIPFEETNDFGYENGTTLFTPVYDSNGIQVCDAFGNALYEYNFIYDFKSIEDGLIELEVCLVDKAGNESDKIKYEVIKDSLISMAGTITYQDFDKPAHLKQEESGVDTNDWFFNFFSITSDKFWSDYTSSGILKFEIDDEVNPRYTVLETTATSNVLSLLKPKLPKRNIALNYHLIITSYTEDGLSVTGEVVYPSCLFVGNIWKYTTNSSDKYYLSYIDPAPGDFENVIVCYTYQESEESDPGSLTYGTVGSYSEKGAFDITNFFEGKPNGIYNIYLAKREAHLSWGSGNRLYSSLGTPYKYYHGITDPTEIREDLEFPSFSIEEKTYISNESKVEISLGMEYTEKNGVRYQAYCVQSNNKSSSGVYPESLNFELKSGNKWIVKIVARNSEGKIIGISEQSENLDLTEVDNHKPTFSVTASKQENCVSTTDLRVHGSIYDINKTGGQAYTINTVDYYFVPYAKQKTLSLEEISAFRKNTIIIDTPQSGIKKIPYNGLENGYYWLYTYLEDDAGNYRLSCLTFPFRYYVIERVPKFEVVNDNLKITAIAYSDSEKPKYYSNEGKSLSSYPITGDYVNIEYLDTTTDTWKDSTFVNEKMDQKDNATECTLSLSKADIAASYNLNQYIRVNVKFANESESYALHLMHFKPLYVLPAYEAGLVTCKNKSWIDVANGKQIFCDAPSFCHTMYCVKKLSEAPAANASNEEVAKLALEWETRGVETGIVSNNTMYSYTNENLAGVPSGSYYTTICHFADGTVVMTDPVQKP